MDETKLRTIAQLREFLDATPVVKFTLAAGAGDAERYEHISRVLKRFDYPRRNKSERGFDHGGCVQKFLQLRNRAQLCLIHVDHHPWMIKPMAAGPKN